MKASPIIDLRSDTVTKPTPAMLEVMRSAEVGDDVFHEDPAINALETAVAARLGKEAALFVPSGTMANQIALNIHTRPGDSVICENDAHCFRFEAGGAAALSGVQPVYVTSQQWSAPDVINDHRLSTEIHQATTTLLSIENTHNVSGGRAFAPEMLWRVTKQAKSLGLATHCDGARLWNAAIATETPVKDLALGFDTVAVCFSKGLGAPVGSALCGTSGLIERARKVRKRLGGGMRQAGSLAAAAMYALENHYERLAEDHRRAKLFSDGLAKLEKAGLHFEIKYPEIPTNMVYFRLDATDGDAMAEILGDLGIKLCHLGGGWLRVVTHLHISDSDVEQAIAGLKEAAKKSRSH